MTTATKTETNRSSGILLHPTSLPGPYGIGDLGRAAFAWLDALKRAGQTWWQILPLNPTGFGDSPYQSFSAFAGNPYLISPEALVRDGLIKQDDLAGVRLPDDRVDYGSVIDFKSRMLDRAWANFQSGSAAGMRGDFDAFCNKQERWLADFALFMALKGAHGGASWLKWPQGLITRQPEALQQSRHDLAERIGSHKFRQFLFARQWSEVKRYARQLGIKLIGDVPIFVSSDSVDVWANPALFLLDERRQPRVVAGVPPDYFSKTGQLWGNPLYNWEALEQTGYQWWIDRLRTALEQVDWLRLDHFRGFEAHWEIPAGMPTAEIGRWVKGPGPKLFHRLREGLAGLPLIAEDLGIITPEVELLRDTFELPGMRILQFAFGGATENRFLPHNYDKNTIVYSGTHDNDTTRAWYLSLNPHEADFVRRYLGRDGHDIAWDLIRIAWASVADYAIAPLQDVLNLGPDGRMNLPGRPGGNWTWRFRIEALNESVLNRLRGLTDVYSR